MRYLIEQAESTGGFPGERTWEGVRFAYKPATRDDAPLVFVFSGFPSAGKPRYNYLRALKRTDAHRVYVLDDIGIRGGYYLGLPVVELIEQAATDHHGPVVTAGSSKGATAAIMFGFASPHVTHVIAGGPQFYIGDYVRKAAPDVADYMGAWDNPHLDRIVEEAVRSREGKPPGVRLLCSRNDHHHDLHLTPLRQLLDQLGIRYSYREARYTGHGEIGEPFGRYLREAIERLACVAA